MQLYRLQELRAVAAHLRALRCLSVWLALKLNGVNDITWCLRHALTVLDVFIIT